MSDVYTCPKCGATLREHDESWDFSLGEHFALQLIGWPVFVVVLYAFYAHDVDGVISPPSSRQRSASSSRGASPVHAKPTSLNVFRARSACAYLLVARCAPSSCRVATMRPLKKHILGD
jgi:hypothetical protein